jgi:succinylglutamate desuccinylase
MNRSYDNELNEFYDHVARMKNHPGNVLFESEQLIVFKSDQEIVNVGIVVGTHGNEVAGIAALNEFLNEQRQRDFPKGLSLTLAIGNIEAGRQGKRFVEKDLNRCFGETAGGAQEEKIAREYETWLTKCQYVLDIHQTIEPSKSAFFIVPDLDKFQKLAGQVNASLKMNLPILAFPMGNAHSDGAPLDDYLAHHNVNPLSVELGQKGFDENQIQLGKDCIYNFVQLCVGGFDPIYQVTNPILRKKTFVPNDAQKTGVLRPGLENFTVIKKGESLGECSTGTIFCPQDGFVFFPKYGDMAKVSSELCQIMVPIDQH